MRENYPDPKALGELVLADLTKVINDNWPEGSQPDPLDREAMDHEAYAQSRERVYIGRQEYFDRLDTHAAANDTQPLVILGESGSGKSALLANWVARYRQAHPDALVLQHYIGATPYSADWAAMLRRLMGEFKRRLGLQQDIPDQPDALRSAFPNWLYMAAAKGRVVLVLDALNQLEDRDGAPDLVWLPPVLPENVRLIVSTLPGRPLDEIQKRHWPTLKVELLSADERRKLIAEYLAQHAKSLNAARVERIAAAPPSANPLYLRVLLDELRLVRTHEELEERIGDYLKAESPYALYEKVIARWEQDYEGDSDLVGDTLSLLWAARRGLTETELLQALGKDGEPLPRAKWSPLFLAMSDALISRGGLLTFAHSYLRVAVEKKFLPTTEAKHSAHSRLALYFEFASLPVYVDADGSIHIDEMAAVTSRAMDEEPWQLQAACRWDRLANHLSFLPVFQAACSSGREFEWMQYWQQVLSTAKNHAAPAVDIPDLYLAGFRQLSSNEKILIGSTLGQFLYNLGYYEAADECFEEEAKSTAGNTALSGNRLICASLLNDRGLIQRDCGHEQEAFKLFEEAVATLENSEAEKEEHRSPPDERRLLASILMNQVSVMQNGEGEPQCRRLLERALALMKETTGEWSFEVATVLQGIGNLAMAREDFRDALSLHLEAHAFRRERLGPDHRDVGLSLGNVANALARMEHYYYAISLWERSLEILKKTVGEQHNFSQSVTAPLKDCENLADQAIKRESGFGMVLLVFNSLSPAENPPDPTTTDGAHIVAQGIRDTLIEIWDNSFAHRSSIPVLVLSCPSYETAVSLAQDIQIAKRFPDNLLTWLRIPSVATKFKSPAALLSLLPVRKQFLDWLHNHNFDVLMIKPVTESGATIDRRLLEFVRQSFQNGFKNPSARLASHTDEPNQDSRPIVIEVVPFDKLDGPILGLYTLDQDPRPCVMPASDWQRQKYSPQADDQRATGVFYLNLAGICHWLDKHPKMGLTPLDEWSTSPLMSMATKSREEQHRVFESALSDLMLLVKTRPMNCPPERGVRGCVTNNLNREIEALLTEL